MSERYFAKIVKVIDKFTVVINAGSEKGVRQGQAFLIVGLGETIMDPDTNESLGSLEIVRGKAKATHVQDRISTLASAEFEKQPDVKEIKKVTSSGKNSVLVSILGPQETETVTESIKSSDPKIKAFSGVVVGDLAIEA